MSNAERIIKLARAQIGVAERPLGSNNVIYNTDYYGGPVSGAAYPWCCAFIWWLFDQLGLNAEFCGGAKTAYCPFVVNFARNAGLWITDGHYRPGDLILYDWNGDGVADHIGLCVSWTGASGQVIEGNNGDSVALVTRTMNSIMGVYRPAYSDDYTPPENQNGNGGHQNQLNTYTVQSGDTLWDIARRFNTTINELARINGIENVGRIYPGQVLKLRADTEDQPTAVMPDDVYTVRQGDTLWDIADALLGSGWRWYKIAAQNDLSFPYTIYPGDRLKIPKREA